ncbi:MAG: hypothetical protein NTX03_01150, partial [Bacteroidetes bacterium]|nr:hypothetical protein [Bacteroidota bacterium]
MKNILLIAMIAFSVCGYSQTKDRRNNFSVGGGFENYNGDLGNAWFKPDEEWYGFVGLNYGRYLTKSFDVNTSLTYGDYGHCREADENQFRPDGSE